MVNLNKNKRDKRDKRERGIPLLLLFFLLLATFIFQFILQTHIEVWADGGKKVGIIGNVAGNTESLDIILKDMKKLGVTDVILSGDLLEEDTIKKSDFAKVKERVAEIAAILKQNSFSGGINLSFNPTKIVESIENDRLPGAKSLDRVQELKNLFKGMPEVSFDNPQSEMVKTIGGKKIKCAGAATSVADESVDLEVIASGTSGYYDAQLAKKEIGAGVRPLVTLGRLKKVAITPPTLGGGVPAIERDKNNGHYMIYNTDNNNVDVHDIYKISTDSRVESFLLKKETKKKEEEGDKAKVADKNDVDKVDKVDKDNKVDQDDKEEERTKSCPDKDDVDRLSEKAKDMRKIAIAADSGVEDRGEKGAKTSNSGNTEGNGLTQRDEAIYGKKKDNGGGSGFGPIAPMMMGAGATYGDAFSLINGATSPATSFPYRNQLLNTGFPGMLGVSYLSGAPGTFYPLNNGGFRGFMMGVPLLGVVPYR
ncbi:MAG: hypothetical protein HQK51_16690 [Oligoflexia bacterium]|nr:hypothetical protein [Oligoflexia bacterium]